MQATSFCPHRPCMLRCHLSVPQGAGLFRNGMNGNVSNIFYENNDAALNGGGLYMVCRGLDFTLMWKCLTLLLHLLFHPAPSSRNLCS